MASWSDVNAKAKYGITLQPVGGKPGTTAANPARYVLRRAGLAGNNMPDHSPFTPMVVKRAGARTVVPVHVSTRMAARSTLSQVKAKATNTRGNLLKFFGVKANR